MDSQLFLLTPDAQLISQLNSELSPPHSLVVGGSLDSACRVLGTTPVRAVLAHVNGKTLNGHSPSGFFSELRQAAGQAPIFALVDESCPRAVRSLAETTVHRCLRASHAAEQLPGLLAMPRAEGGSDPLDRLSAVPHRSLRGKTVSITTFTPAMFGILDELEVAARHDVTVLLIGETGSGKTFIARLLHELSSRADKRFCQIACGVLPGELIESELFGYAKGAFTGAERERIGKFAAAGGGTLLLDEIDVLSLRQQANLLRVIETGEYEPLGCNDTSVSDARLIVASNVDLEQLVAAGKFRSDLYFRLNVMKIYLPPLRERPRDIEFLTRMFVRNHCRKHGISDLSIEPELFQAVRSHDWPGNVRELENVIRRAVLYCRGHVLMAKHLPDGIGRRSSRRSDVGVSCEPQTLERRISRFEQRLIEESLQRNKNRRTATARELGISRVTLYNKMKKFGMLASTSHARRFGTPSAS